MILDILKGFVIGATAAMPVGPIAILVIQKTMGKGRKAGFVTGLGAAAVHMGVQWIEYSSALEALHMDSGDASLYAGFLARDGFVNAPIGFEQVRDVLFTPTVGASGAIYGILLGYAMLYPDSVLTLLFPPVSLKAKWFVLIFAAIELLTGVTGTGGGIAHFAHLGGLIFGFLLIMYWKKKRTLYSRFD